MQTRGYCRYKNTVSFSFANFRFFAFHLLIHTGCYILLGLKKYSNHGTNILYLAQNFNYLFHNFAKFKPFFKILLQKRYNTSIIFLKLRLLFASTSLLLLPSLSLSLFFFLSASCLSSFFF